MKKLTTFTSVALIVCAVAISYTVSILGFQNLLSADDKVNAAFLLASFFLTSVAVERITILADIRRTIRKVLEELTVSRSNFQSVKNFKKIEDFVEDAEELLMVGLTKMGNVTERTGFYSELIRQGCKVRIAVLDPSVENLYNIVSDSTNHSRDRLLLDIKQSIETLITIRKALSPEENARLSVRFYGCAPSAGIIKIKSGDREQIQAYFYPYKTDPIDRLGFEIDRKFDLALYEYFSIRYERLWSDISSSRDPTIASSSH